MKAYICLGFLLISAATNALAQVNNSKDFPIFFWDDRTQRNLYDSAKNVQLNGLELTFDIKGIHYVAVAFPGVRVDVSLYTRDKIDKDSVIGSKVLLFPCQVPIYGQTVIAVQVFYYYKNSRELEGYSFTPLSSYRTLEEAKKERHLENEDGK